jgi:maleylpyruvate isomerase
LQGGPDGLAASVGGYGFRDIPADAARWIVEDIAEALALGPHTPPLRLETTDTGLVRRLGTGGPTVRGPWADLLAWLSGRSPGTGLTASGADAVPSAPYWI